MITPELLVVIALCAAASFVVMFMAGKRWFARSVAPAPPPTVEYCVPAQTPVTHASQLGEIRAEAVLVRARSLFPHLDVDMLGRDVHP